MPKPCCAQQPRPRSRKRDGDDPLPANPKVPGGKPMLYLGWGRRAIKGKATGNTYYVSNTRRKFMAAPADVASIVSREVIEKQ